MGKSWWYAPGSAIVQKPERHSAGSLTCRSSWPHGGNYLWGIRYRKEKIPGQRIAAMTTTEHLLTLPTWKARRCHVTPPETREEGLSLLHG